MLFRPAFWSHGPIAAVIYGDQRKFPCVISGLPIEQEPAEVPFLRGCGDSINPASDRLVEVERCWGELGLMPWLELCVSFK